MRKSAFAVVVTAILVTSTTFGEEFRLFTDSFLTVGNEWHYDMFVYMVNGQPFDMHETSSLIVSGATYVSGYNAKTVNLNSSMGNSVTYSCVVGDSMVDVGSRDDDMTETLMNADPIETYPVWVDTSFNNYHWGHGQFRINSHGQTWTRTYDTYVTFLGQEIVTVPAGTWSCKKLRVKNDYVDSNGEHNIVQETLWINPLTGIIKNDTYGWVSYPDGSQMEASYVLELTSTNVVPEPYCKVRTLPMDFNGDCRVDLADFAAFLQQWMNCQLDPPDACFSENQD